MVLIRIHPCGACRVCFEVSLAHSVRWVEDVGYEERPEIRPVPPAPPPFCSNCLALFGYQHCAYLRSVRADQRFALRTYLALGRKGRKNFQAFFGAQFVDEMLSRRVSGRMPGPSPRV